MYINDNHDNSNFNVSNVIDRNNFSHMILAEYCLASEELRSEGIKKGIKFWVERLIISLIRELSFGGDSISHMLLCVL